jgi:hypothetical protein
MLTFLELAKAVNDSHELRDSYLALPLQYERLARILEERDLPDRRASAGSAASVRGGGPG